VILRDSGPILNQAMRRRKDEARLQGYQNSLRRAGFCKTQPKRKTRPGGQPDGSSHMGAWGGWALAPNIASMGRDNRSHIIWSRKAGRTFKAAVRIF
jgi:hypothetical protein